MLFLSADQNLDQKLTWLAWAGLGQTLGSPRSCPGLGQGHALGWALVKPWENSSRDLAQSHGAIKCCEDFFTATDYAEKTRYAGLHYAVHVYLHVYVL